MRKTKLGRWAGGHVIVAAAVALSAAPASADPGHPRDEEGNVIADMMEDVDPGLPGDLGDTLMTDSMTDALSDPDGGVGRTCQKVSRLTRANDTAPAGATQVQVVYFHPSDVTAAEWDRGTLCSDGKTYESSIGHSVQNWRRRMGRQSTTQGDRIYGKAFEVLKRSYSYMGKTGSFIDITHMKGYNTLACYGSDTYNRVKSEMDGRGWNRSYTKYLVQANLYANLWPGTNSSPAGLAAVNGNKAMAFKQLRKKNSDGTYTLKRVRWGCYDEGDTPGAHEVAHALGAVPSGSADYYNSTTNSNHVTQGYDILGYSPKSTISGKHSNGGTFPAPLEWDQGAQSYTDRIAVTQASYLSTMSVTSYKTC